MLAMILLFAVISSGAVFGCFVLKKEYKFEEYVPVSCMAAVLWLFFFGLAGLLQTGVRILVLISVAIYFLAICRLIADKDFNERKGSFFTSGFAFLVLIFAGSIWISYGMKAHDWDEFSHWALVVKEMTAVNELPCNPAVRFTFYKNYPPAMPLFQYLLQKLDCGEFNEWLIYSGYQVFLLSLLLPFFANLNLRKWYDWILIPALILAPSIFYENVYSEIYIDPFLGVASGAVFAMIATMKEDNRMQRIFVLMGISVLSISKEIGILLAAFSAIAYLASEKKVKALWSIAFATIPAILWKCAVARNNVAAQERGSIDMVSFFNVITGNEDSYRIHVFKAFFYPLVHWFLLKIIIIAAMLYIVLRLIKNTSVWRVAVVQTVVYIFGMLLMYMYMFNMTEACALASFSRYIGVACTAMLLCLVLCCTALPDKAKAVLPAVVLAGELFAAPYRQLYSAASRGAIVSAEYVRRPVEERYCEMIRESYEPGSRICYGSGESATMEFFESRYILAPDYDVYWEE